MIRKPKPNPKDHKTDTTTVRVALISATATVLVAVITTVGAFASGWLQYRGPGAPADPASAAASTTAPSTASTAPAETVPTGGTAGDVSTGAGGEQASTAGPGGTNPSGLSVYLADLEEVSEERKGDLRTGPYHVNGVLYEHSVALSYHCATEMIAGYNLDRTYQRLKATIGVEDSAPIGPKVSFQVMLDGKQLGPTYRLGLGETKNLDLDVTGGLRLILRATVAPESRCADLKAVWADARVS